MFALQIRVMCCIDPDRTARELDRAVQCLKGYRDVVLNEKSWWDSWIFPEEDKKYYAYLFVTRPQDIWEPHPIEII